MPGMSLTLVASELNPFVQTAKLELMACCPYSLLLDSCLESRGILRCRYRQSGVAESLLTAAIQLDVSVLDLRQC